MPTHTHSTPATPWWRRLFPVLLVVGGAAAWVIVLVAVLNTASDEDSSEPDAPVDGVSQRPTLSVATPTPMATTTVAPTPTHTLTPTRTPSRTPSHTPSAAPTQPLLPPSTAAPTDVPISTATPVPSPTPLVVADSAPDTTGASEPAEPVESTALGEGCSPPDGWERYVVQPGDTLFAFALGADMAVTVDDLVVANCLDRRWLQVDEVLYLPPGAAENAPSSDPSVSADTGSTGPRTPNCPCTINVPQGWRREQLAAAIQASQTMFTGADFLAVTGPGASTPYDFANSRPPGTSLEGFLFPGTYTAQNDTTAEGFRDMMLEAFAANVTPQMRADAAAQGVSFYEALVIASIVQREVRGPETQKLVASVYYNRHRAGSRLGATVTVQYALGQPGNWWPRVTASGLEVDSPYNTYNRAGLPPTPIDSPGLSAILATIYPPQTNYYYHTASCDGTGEAFAETYEEHLANVNCE
jgi:hypothetical protein